MDLDADGHDDIISGSYWPGDLFVFPGLGEGKYGARQTLQDGEGNNVNAGPPWQSEEVPDMDSLAAAPFFADIDADGDLDLLVGNIAGRVILIKNDGTAKKAAFSKQKKALESQGKPIRVHGGDAGPVMVDWNKNGLLDLVVGAGDGAVWLYPNEGTPSEPTFGEGRKLVETSAAYGQNAKHGEEPTSPASRSKVHITDYNGDGLLDLLVGDFAMIENPEPDLDPDQIALRDELRLERDALQEDIQALLAEKSADFNSEDDPEFAAILDEMGEVRSELREYEAGTTMHGWVWLFLQKNTAQAAAATSTY